MGDTKLEAIKRYVKSQTEDYFDSVLGGEEKAKMLGRTWKNIGEDLEILKELMVHEYIVNMSETPEDREVYKLALENIMLIFKNCADKVQEEDKDL